MRVHFDSIYAETKVELLYNQLLLPIESEACTVRKTLRITLTSLLVLACFSGFSLAAESTKIGIVHIPFVIDESKEGQKANQEINELIAKHQGSLDALEAEIAELQNELAQIPEDDDDTEARQQKVNEVDRLVDTYIENMERYESEIQQRMQVLRDNILEDIGNVLQIFGDREDYDIILDSSVALYFRHAADITWDVIQKYDELVEAGEL